MRWFWFATLTLVCSLLSVLYRQPLILLGELLLIELFITRKFKFFRKIYHPAFKVSSWISLTLWILVTGWVIRMLVFDSLTVRHSSERPILQPGDIILVSKLTPGPRLPMTPLGIPFCRQYLPFATCTPSYLSKPSLPYLRLPGLGHLRRGDLIAFNFPEGDTVVCGFGNRNYYSLVRMKLAKGDPLPSNDLARHPLDRREPLLSRCIGLPGDTVLIRSGRVVTPATFEGDLSEKAGLHPSPLLFDYLVETGDLRLPQSLLDEMGIPPGETNYLPSLGYLLPLSPGQLNRIRIRPEVRKCTAYLMEPGEGDYNIFPHDARYPWNRDNFGPVIVPRKGDTARLSLDNLGIYRRIIEVYERNRLEILDGKIYLNGIETGSYTFRQDYFFVLGDNRHHSSDSRHWGFLPMDHVIGKPIFIWFSSAGGPGKPFHIFWNRILKTPV